MDASERLGFVLGYYEVSVDDVTDSDKAEVVSCLAGKSGNSSLRGFKPLELLLSSDGEGRAKRRVYTPGITLRGVELTTHCREICSTRKWHIRKCHHRALLLNRGCHLILWDGVYEAAASTHEYSSLSVSALSNSDLVNLLKTESEFFAKFILGLHEIQSQSLAIRIIEAEDLRRAVLGTEQVARHLSIYLPRV